MGIYYAQARFYNPEIKRFTSEDPIKDGLNWYAYVGNNPVNSVDPLGLRTITISVAASAAFGVGISGSIGLAIDDKGNSGILLSGSVLGATPNLSTSLAFTFTNSDTIYDLKGNSVEFGGSLGPVGLEATSNGANNGFAISGGVGIPVELHVGLSYGKLIGNGFKKIEQWVKDKSKEYMNKLTCGQKDIIRSKGYGVFLND